MSWHYLQGQEEASWADTFLDGAPSALLSMLPTPGASCLPDNGTECSHGSPFGMTLQRSTGTHGEVELMWFRAGSPVRTYRSLERERDLVESEADCGPKWPGSLARYNPGSRSWRTAQCSLLGGLELYSATFPRWGTLRNGELWERTMPVLPTAGNESGLWRTPTFHDFKNSSCSTQIYLSDQVMQRPKKLVPFPTPTANERDGRDLDKRLRDGRQMGLGEVVRMRTANTPSGNWPTPTCSDAFTDKLKSDQQKEGSMHSVNLSQAVKMFPTPTATDYKGAYTKESMVSSGGIDRAGLLRNVGHMDNPDYKAAVGGQLNPEFVEYLMHWPRNWTSLEPMEPVAYIAWLMGKGHETEKGNTEEVRELRNDDDAQAIRDQVGRCGGVQTPSVLLPELREHAQGSEVHRHKSTEASERSLRNVRIVEPQTGSPQGPEPREQRTGEHPNVVRELPHETALGRGEEGLSEVPAELRCLWEGNNARAMRYTPDEVQAIWERATGEEKDWIRLAAIRGNWHAEWPGVPRIAVGIPKRADRLKAIGNGQVPAAAALAWNTLYARIAR